MLKRMRLRDNWWGRDLLCSPSTIQHNFYFFRKNKMAVLTSLTSGSPAGISGSPIGTQFPCSTSGSNQRVTAVIPVRGSWRPPPRSHVGAHTINLAMSVCPHFLASFLRFRLLSQDRKLCFCRLREKVARSRQQI